MIRNLTYTGVLPSGESRYPVIEALQIIPSRIVATNSRYIEENGVKYDATDLPAKEMIVANHINRIEVGRGYEIHIDFKIDLSQFNINANFGA